MTIIAPRARHPHPFMQRQASRHRKLAALLTVSLFLVGCVTDTGELATDDITLAFEITLGGGEGVLQGEVKEAGKSLNLDLASGDSLVAVVDGADEITLSRDGDSGPYLTSLPLDARTVELRFDRADHANAAMTTEIPAVADITSPGTFSQQDEEIPITWSNAEEGADATVFASSCADVTVTFDREGTTKTAVPDDGSYTFTKAELEAEAGFTPDCARLQLLRRYYLREYPAGTHQSSFLSQRHQSFEISLTP